MCKELDKNHSNQEDRLKRTFEDLFDLPISTATLAGFNNSFSEKVKVHQERTLNQLKMIEARHFDEMGLRIIGKNQWLHVVSNYLMLII